MDRREELLRALREFIGRNAQVARDFRREYEAVTWLAVEQAVQQDPDGVAEYAELAVWAIGQLRDETSPR